MTTPGRVSHLLPGANTPQGFYSLYDHIARIDANKIFVIKGGPGVGKSTFMKRIAQDLIDRGHDVEFHHCSADNNSLDGLYIPGADIALLDGTAPHVVDPKNPGAVDEILNLGEYWNEATISAPENRTQILRHNRACGFRFKRANDVLRAAKSYLDEWAAYNADCVDNGAILSTSEDLIAALLPQRLPKQGAARRLFASAITYDGPKHWLGNLFDGCAKRYIIKGDPGTGKSTIVGRLADAALARGYSLDLFHCPMYPERIDHMKIRDTNIGIITSFWPHEYTPQPGDEVIDTNTFLDHDRLSAYAPDIAAARESYESAIEREIAHLDMAKKIHDEMERYYIPHMDFGAIEQFRQKTLGRILELIAARQSTPAQQ